MILIFVLMLINLSFSCGIFLLTRNHKKKFLHFNDLSPHSGHQIVIAAIPIPGSTSIGKGITTIFINDYLLDNHWWVQSHYYRCIILIWWFLLDRTWAPRQYTGSIIWSLNTIWLIKSLTFTDLLFHILSFYQSFALPTKYLIKEIKIYLQEKFMFSFLRSYMGWRVMHAKLLDC